MNFHRTFHVYADHSGNWRWREKARNGRIVSCSGESFSSKRKARDAAYREAMLRNCIVLVRCE